jgi:hypothetical protein
MHILGMQGVSNCKHASAGKEIWLGWSSYYFEDNNKRNYVIKIDTES